MPPEADFFLAVSCAVKVNAANAAASNIRLLRFNVPSTSLQAYHSLAVKLISWAPIRQFLLVGDILAQQEAELRGLLHGGKVPIFLKLVGRLMVVLGVVLLPHLLPIPFRLAGKFGGSPDGECRDAGMREREVVGAEIVALLGRVLRGNRQVQPFGDLLRRGQYRGALRAREHHILGPPPG